MAGRPAADRRVCPTFRARVPEKGRQGRQKYKEVVLSKDDGCVQLYCQGETAKDDAMMILQPGAETFDELRQLDGAVGERLLVQETRRLVGPQSLGLFQGAVSKDFFQGGTLRDKFPVTYCAQESSCRSEDVRLRARVRHRIPMGWSGLLCGRRASSRGKT